MGRPPRDPAQRTIFIAKLFPTNKGGHLRTGLGIVPGGVFHAASFISVAEGAGFRFVSYTRPVFYSLEGHKKQGSFIDAGLRAG